MAYWLINHYYHRMVPMVRTLQQGTQAWQQPSTHGRIKAAYIITPYPLVSARQRVNSRNSYGKQQPKWAAPLRVVTVRFFPEAAVAPKSGSLSASTHRPETLLVIITSTSKRMCNNQSVELVLDYGLGSGLRMSIESRSWYSLLSLNLSGKYGQFT